MINEETNYISSYFIPFAGRHLHEVKVDITDTLSTTEIEKRIDENLENINNRDLIKIILTGKIELNSEIDINYLEKKYNSAYYFAKIYDESTLKIDYMTYEYDASLKGEFIRLVLKQNLTEDEMKNIITTGIKALSGEDIY